MNQVTLNTDWYKSFAYNLAYDEPEETMRKKHAELTDALVNLITPQAQPFFQPLPNFQWEEYTKSGPLQTVYYPQDTLYRLLGDFAKRLDEQNGTLWSRWSAVAHVRRTRVADENAHHPIVALSITFGFYDIEPGETSTFQVTYELQYICNAVEAEHFAIIGDFPGPGFESAPGDRYVLDNYTGYVSPFVMPYERKKVITIAATLRGWQEVSFDGDNAVFSI